MASAGRAEFLVSLQGQDKLTSVLTNAQKNMEKLGKRTKEAVNKSKGFAKISGSIKGIGTNWTELSSKVNLFTMGLQTAIGMYRGLINHLKEGEIASNAARIFNQIQDNAGETMEALQGVSKGIMTDTDIQQLSNKMTLLGAAADQQAEIINLAVGQHLATGEAIRPTVEKLINATLSGRAASLRMLGVNIDLTKATKEHAAAMGQTVDQMTNQELVYARLAVVIEALEGKFARVDFDSLTMDAHKFDTATANLVSTMQEMAAAAGTATTATIGLRRAQDASATATLRNLGALEDFDFGQKMAEGSKIVHDMIREIGVKPSSEVRDQWHNLQIAIRRMGGMTRAEMENMREEFQLEGNASQRSLKRMQEVTRNFVRRMHQEHRVEGQRNMEQIRAIQNEIEISMILQNAAADKSDAAHNKSLENKSTAGKKNAAATMARNNRMEEINRQHGDMMSGIDDARGIELRRWGRESLAIMEEFAEDVSTFGKAFAIGARAHKAALEKIDEDALGKSLAQSHKFAMLHAQLAKSQIAADDDAGRKRADRAMAALELKHKLDSGEINAEEYRLRTLIDLNKAHNESERELLQERERYRQEAYQAAQDMNAEALALATTEKDDVATGLAVVGESMGLIAGNMKQIAKGSPAAIAAVANMASAGIRDQRAASFVRGGVAAAESLFYFATGMFPQGIAMAAASAAFFKVAGGGGGGGGGGAKTTGIVGAGGGGESLGTIQGAATTTVVNVTGFVGSNASLANDISRAQNESSAAGFSDSAEI